MVAFDAVTVATAARTSALIPHARSPSQIAHTIGEKAAEPTAMSPSADPLDDDFIPLLGVGGKDYGTWWHDTLQLFPWRADDLARRKFLGEAGRAVPAHAEWKARAVEESLRFANAIIAREIVESGKLIESEIPFAHASAGEPPAWTEGILDLLVVRDDGTAWIVDWKTDRRQEGESSDQLLARLKATYSAQLAAYAAAIESAGRTVTRRSIYSTVLGSAIDC